MAELRFMDLTDAPVEYLDAWERQREVHAEVVSGGDGTVLLLEHPPVYTAGKRTEPHERPSTGSGTEGAGSGTEGAGSGTEGAGAGAEGPTVPVIDVDRGGKITFHGPGQLVGYPIVRLPDHVLVVDYVRRLEEALIAVCRDLGVRTARVPGRSGVWLQADDRGPERKIAAIGIRVSRGVTMHGFALNCDVDLAYYERFVPCGISDAGVTSLSQELGRRVTVDEVLPTVREHLADLLAWNDYEPTPDYDARPDPSKAGAHSSGGGQSHHLRVPVLNPLG